MSGPRRGNHPRFVALPGGRTEPTPTLVRCCCSRCLGRLWPVERYLAHKDGWA